MNSPSPAPISPHVHRQAAEWLVELQSDVVSEATRRRWQQWRDAHPEHERAWSRVESFSGRLQGLPSPLVHAALAPPDSMRRRRVFKTLAVLLFTGGAAWTVEEKTSWRHWTADRHTGIGEQASVTLPDGTHIELNSSTAIDIRFTDTERTLRLFGGEILVTTAHGPLLNSGALDLRPFVVQTAQARIRALGTRFSVRNLDARADSSGRVAVFEGAVEVRPDHSPAAPSLVQAGQRTRFTRDGTDAVTPVDESEVAWRQGMIAVQDMPLAEFLSELGRHRPGQLTCDPAIASLKVTGTYPLGDTDRVLAVLEATLPIKVHFVTRYWVRVRPEPQRG